MRICLTGGIACGKSLLADALRAHGFPILDADDVVHSLEAPGGPAADAVFSRFGTLSRPALARIVFSDPVARRDLEAILFPLVREEMKRFDGLSVIPLLYENGWEKDFDKVVCIAADRETQIRRMAEFRGLSRVEAEARLNAQMPVSEKAARADYTVVNDSTPEALLEQASTLADWLKQNG